MYKVENEEFDNEEFDNEELVNDQVSDVDDVADNEEAEDQEIITIGEPDEALLAADPEEDLPKIKQWRKEFKETARRNRELEAELQALKAPIQHAGNQSVPLAKPTLEDCDYDVDLFEASLISWSEVERQKQSQQIEMQRQQEQQQAEWAGRVNTYEQAKTTLKVPDFDESEEEVIKNLNVNQQGLILKYAKESAKIIYALGKAPEKLKELSTISDPIAFALALSDIEREIRVTRKSNIKPESRIESGGIAAVNSDARLEKLRDKARVTGDFTEVIKYKKAMKK